jgi:hypothetical protein
MGRIGRNEGLLYEMVCRLERDVSPWQLLFLLVEALEAVMGCIEWTGSIHWCWMGKQRTSYRKKENTLQLTSVTKRLMMNIQHLQKAGKAGRSLGRSRPEGAC